MVTQPPKPLTERSIEDLMNKQYIHNMELLENIENDNMESLNNEGIMLDSINKEIMSRSVKERETFFFANYVEFMEAYDIKDEALSDLYKQKISYFRKVFLKDSEHVKKRKFAGLDYKE